MSNLKKKHQQRALSDKWTNVPLRSLTAPWLLVQLSAVSTFRRSSTSFLFPSVGDAQISSIGRGLCVLLGVSVEDTQTDADYMWVCRRDWEGNITSLCGISSFVLLDTFFWRLNSWQRHSCRPQYPPPLWCVKRYNLGVIPRSEHTHWREHAGALQNVVNIVENFRKPRIFSIYHM